MLPLEEQQPTKIQPKILLLPLLVALGLIAVFLRLWYLQIVRGDELSRQASKGHSMSVPIPSPRGQIVDREGAALAGVKPTLALMITPVDIEKNREAIERAAAIVGLDADGLEKEIKDRKHPKYLPFAAKFGISNEQAVAVEEQRAFIPGVSVRPESVRVYPIGPSAAHIVGYVGALDDKDVDRYLQLGRDLPNFTGKVGIERMYDEKLMGLEGKESVDVDARGKQLRPRTTEPPTPGDKLILTIDADLQKYATAIFAGRKGAVVALDPKNGEILCMVSSPTYDANYFAQRGPTEKIQAILTNPMQPMHNRASGSAYAPGSAFKIATLVAGIRSGVITPETHFYCNGAIRIGRRIFKCLGHHGSIEYSRAIEKSCNVFFGEAGRRIERKRIAEAANDLGLGKKTGIDLYGERTGIIPSDEWLSSRKLRWYPGDTINMAVGQGYVETTPLQMADYIALVANRGVAYKPHLLRATIPAGASSKPVPTEVTVLNRVDLPDIWWDRIYGALIRVVESGTARRAQISGVRVAGKTGSAEHGAGKTSHGWFVAFAPVEDPKIAIAVVLETAGHGGDVAAPVAKQVMEWYLKHQSATSAKARSTSAAFDSSPPAR